MKPVKLGDVTLQVLDRGTGPVILFVHGFPLDHTMWSAQITELAPHCRVVAPDLRGFGASQGAGDVLTMERLADDLKDLLAALQIEQPVVFCGLSMGGYVAWQFVRRHRQHIAALVLCDTRAAADTEQVARGRLYLAERVLAEGTRGTSEEMLHKLFAPCTITAAPELVAQVLAVMAGTAPETVAAAQRGMAQRADMGELLPSIDCPTLVLCGEQDQITPRAEMQALADRIRGATFVTIPEAGHLAPLENPPLVNLALRQFLQANRLIPV